MFQGLAGLGLTDLALGGFHLGILDLLTGCQ